MHVGGWTTQQLCVRARDEHGKARTSSSLLFVCWFVDDSSKHCTVLTSPCLLSLSISLSNLSKTNPFWKLVRSFLSEPSEEEVACHAPKPILLNLGDVTSPYAWEPSKVPISVFRVGKLFILNVPGEFTTMAGRRLRTAVSEILVSFGVDDPIITIAGLANSYSHYITTIEEYAGQRYEAASTLYGPHTLQAYIQEFERITRDLMTGVPSISQSPPVDMSKKQLSLLPPVEFDSIGIGRKVPSLFVSAAFLWSQTPLHLLTVFCLKFMVFLLSWHATSPPFRLSLPMFSITVWIGGN